MLMGWRFICTSGTVRTRCSCWRAQCHGAARPYAFCSDGRKISSLFIRFQEIPACLVQRVSMEAACELSIMEVLYLVDKNETYEHASLLMEGLKTSRPGVVQELLEKTTSIKVKR